MPRHIRVLSDHIFFFQVFQFFRELPEAVFIVLDKRDIDLLFQIMDAILHRQFFQGFVYDFFQILIKNLGFLEIWIVLQNDLKIVV